MGLFLGCKDQSLHHTRLGQIVSWMPLALKRSPSCRRLWRRRAGKALLTHAPTSTLGPWELALEFAERHTRGGSSC
eukprot:4187321-Amphidinium_carterae.1